VGGDEHLERGALVAVEEAEQRLRIFTDVVVHVQKGRGAWLELGQCARGDRHQISDTTHFH